MFDKLLEDYITENTDKPSDELEEIERITKLSVKRPHMISGAYQGRLLAMISKMIRPSKILEIGTYTGYSTICLFEGLSPKGIIHTIEKDEEIFNIAKENFQRLKLDSLINIHKGDAVELMNFLGADFDLIFIDANKSKYLEYYTKALTILKSGGYIIVDNVLWKNKVLCENDTKDKFTEIIKNFNHFIKNDASVEKILLPIRDGIYLLRKK